MRFSVGDGDVARLNDLARRRGSSLPACPANGMARVIRRNPPQFVRGGPTTRRVLAPYSALNASGSEAAPGDSDSM